MTWSPPANEGSAINNYNLEIGGNAGEVRAVGNRTTYVWDGLQNGAEYTFRVQAVNQKGEGEWSASSASEHPLTTPDPTGTPVGTRGDGYIDLVVVARRQRRRPDHAVPRADQQHRRDAGRQRHQLPVAEPAQRPGPVLPGPGVQPGRMGPVLGLVDAGDALRAPTAPTGVQATRGDQSATVTWGPSDARGCAISQYTVRASGGGSTTVGGGTTSATVGGLSNGTTYTFTVVATNEVGNSPAERPEQRRRPGRAARPAEPDQRRPVGRAASPGLEGGRPERQRGAALRAQHQRRRLAERRQHDQPSGVRARRRGRRTRSRSGP